MFHLLSDEIIENIFKLCYNFDIFSLHSVSKCFNQIINQEYFIDYIDNRYHPLVFNLNDLYQFKIPVQKIL